jgi:NADPH:quinone reductase-like Zn-dependent oxidoreductase/acyl carrier protein
MQALPAGGGMLALLASQAQAEALLAEVPGLSLAALNGPANTVVSGPLQAIQTLEPLAAAAGIKATRLAVSHAFHSPAMAPMLAEFEQLLGGIAFKPPALPLLSNLTGRLAGPEIATSDYWCDHLIQPVRFAEGITAAAAQGVSTFLELGARPTLISMGRQCLSDPELQWWPSLRPGQPDLQQLLSALAGLYRQGFAVDWKAVHRPFPHRRMELPGYPFQRQRYWWSPVQEGASLWLDHIKGGRSAPMQATPVMEAGRLEPLSLPGGQEQRFQIQLSAEHVLDHRIRSQVVFPAAGFIVLALQALAQQDEPLALVELNLDQPLRLAPELTPVQLVLGEALEFHSEGPAGWRSHGSCRWGAADAPEPLPPLPAETTALDLSAFYGALARFGLSYGPSFRPLTRLQRIADQAWAELKRPAGAGDWALLDGCFQAVAATLDPDAAAGQLFLPVGFETLQLEQLPLPDALECRVQLRASDEPAFVKADLQLFAAGERIGWVQGFRLRRLPRQALDWLFPLEQDSTSEQPEHQRWLVRQGWLPLEVDLGACTVAPPDDLPLHWPDPQGLSVLEATGELLALAQQSPAEVWLVLEGQGPLQEALAAFARTAALERPATRWFCLQLPAGAKAEQLPIPWEQIRQLAAAEPALAFDGTRLLKQRLLPLPPARFRYGTASFGLLESLRPEALPPQAPAAGELEIAVEATGLNFRDVLNALGLLRSYSRQLGLDEAAQVPFGGECVGRVTAVGEGVDPGLVGQRVLAALAVGSLASHVVCRSELCAPLPETLTPEQGASLSTAFLTAIYGLETLAKLQPGESVLIHAAAGGVGQAALQVALRLGARVYATASSSKQARLLEQGCTAVFDSRSLDFAEQLLAATAGQGVDVVLNSLKGEWVDASFEALAQGGRFVELGKIEIWSKAEAAERRPDARYLPFDLLEVAAAQPDLVRELLKQFLSDLVSGTYQMLPLQSFPVEQTVEAFRLMAQARHVGKVVITQPPRPAALTQISAEGSYVITGAFGGIGLQLVRWLVEQGARSLLLIARSAANPSPEAQALLKELEAKGVRCRSLALDLADSAAVAPLAETLRGAELRGVFHAAGVLDDRLLEWQNHERLEGVLAPKWSGWQTLEAAMELAQANPALVVQFSSMAALLGSPGQSNYAAANGALDGAIAALNSPGWLSLQWGPWAGGGMAGALEERQQQRLEALGVRMLDPQLALAALGDLISRGVSGSIGVLDVDWARIARQAGARQGAPLELMAAAEEATGDAPSGPPPTVVLLQETPPAERRAVLQGFVQQQLAKVMGVADPGQIDPGEPLFNMGLDSLMALELMVLLEKNLGITLTEALVFEHPTIEDLVRYFLSVLFEELTPSAPVVASTSTPVVAEAIDPAWEERLQAVTELSDEELLSQLQGGA